ncbi:MAG: Rap1a/Tai family immunity protein [Candidatus Methylomirabilales bacterium]
MDRCPDRIDGLCACIPETVSASLVRDLVRKWINEKPELGQMKTSPVVAKTMAEAFPCK